METQEMYETSNGLLDHVDSDNQNKLDPNIHLTFNDVHIKPKYSKIKSRSLCDTSTDLSKNRQIDLPFVASPMDTVCGEEMAVEMWRLGGVGVIHRFDDIQTQARRVSNTVKSIEKIKQSRIDDSDVICAAIGATGDYLERADALITEGVNTLLIDVAHGHHQYVHNTLTELKMKRPNIDVIAGSIATAEAAEALIAWGADGLRVGIGGGSMCETRIRAGVGVPQITALLNILQVSDQHGVPVMADGGIKTPGDAAKAVATGASTVMLGSVLSGTKETPGPFQRRGKWPNEQLFKEYRGSASFASKRDRGEKVMNIEGTSRIVAYKGDAERVIKGLKQGLQSSMSYVGAKTIQKFHENAQLIRVSMAGHIEGTPHGVTD